jgi:SAM-dependent methyltransferase
MSTALPMTALRGPTPSDVVTHFAGWEFGEEEHTYIAYHATRYSYLLSLVAHALRGAGAGPGGEGARILDIAPLFEVDLLRTWFPAARVDTVGFEHPTFPARDDEGHVEFDLNDAAIPSRWPDAGQTDVAIMGEVIEHLHAHPGKVLACVASWVRPGGRLFVQTPNAIALHKRIRMLVGRSPFEPIRDSEKNPGHFHEYTADELAAHARSAGWQSIEVSVTNYFQPAGLGGRAYNTVGRRLPASLRHGITLSAQRA